MARDAALHLASGACIEKLERRRMLTTLTSTVGQDAVLLYSDTRGGAAEITVSGNTTAEFIFFDGANVTDAIPAGTPNGADLFQIYVAKSDMTSTIAVQRVVLTPTSFERRPFAGTVPTFLISKANPDTETPPTANPPANSGSLVLGFISAGSPAIPEIKTTLSGAWGVRPAGLDDLPDPQDPNNLSAGLIVANGQSLGRFAFDGAIFGKVEVPGDMKQFYGGWILTGDARGATQGFPSAPFNNIPDPADGIPQEFNDFPLTVPRNNFYIGGDVENIATVGHIGWDGSYLGDNLLFPQYLTGAEILVGGRVGAITTSNFGTELGTLGSSASAAAGNDTGIAGNIHIANNPRPNRPITIQRELEPLQQFGLPDFTDAVFPPDTDFAHGFPVRDDGLSSPFRNDNFSTAQLLGSFNTPLGQDSIDLFGTISTTTPIPFDNSDYFGIALMAGQTIRLQMIAGFFGGGGITGNSRAFVGVFDPDGRQIASDYDNGKHGADVKNAPFQFTADRPGIYRIAIGTNGDANFLGQPTLFTTQDYNLRITRLGNVAIGGIQTRGDMLDPHSGIESVRVDNGALGAIHVEAGDTGAQATSRYIVPAFKTQSKELPTPVPPIPTFVLTYSISVLNGDFRSFETGQIGVGTADGGSITLETGPDLSVPNGSIGLVRANLGMLQLNPSGQETDDPVYNVGGDYQVVDAAGQFFGAVITNRRIGTIRAGNFSRGNVIITADADNAGFDGTIDVIESNGAFNGPHITHGPGGNVRYIRAAGEITSDPFFSVGTSQRVTHDFNEAVTFTDDSGSVITLTPVGLQVVNPNFNPLDPTSVQFFGPHLTTRTYGIRSGGVVVVDVNSTGSLAINGSAFAAGGTAEISRAEIHGDAPAPIVTTNAATRRATVALPPLTLGQALTFDVTGTAIVDVLYLGVLTADDQTTLQEVSSVTTFGNATRISNTTGGEIVSVNAASVGELSARGNIGLAKTNILNNSVNFIAPFAVGGGYAGPRDDNGVNEMPVNPAGGNVVGQLFPFHNPGGPNNNPGTNTLANPNQTGQSFGIAVNGNIATIISGGGIGNVVAAGTIESISANNDRQDDAAAFEGLNAPIWVTGGTGTILNVNIGEGIPASGSGEVNFTGLFADVTIDTINNQGLGSDIRGDIAAGTSVGAINLRDGAMIDNDIILTAIGTFAQVRESAGGSQFVNPISPLSRRAFPLGAINISGSRGGMIGTTIVSYSIGPIGINGFGLEAARIVSFGSGRIANMAVGGYGIRDSAITSGATLAGMNAFGNGSHLSTQDVTPSVRLSELVQSDQSIASRSASSFSGMTSR